MDMFGLIATEECDLRTRLHTTAFKQISPLLRPWPQLLWTLDDGE